MEEDAVHFYNNKVRLIIGFIFITALFSGISAFTYFIYGETILLVFLPFLLGTILIGLIWLANFSKLFNRNPYVTITNSSILINPNTKNEIKIEAANIVTVSVVEASFDKRIQFDLRDEDTLFENLSVLSKILYGPDKILGQKIFYIQYGLIKKHKRPLFLKAFDDFITQSVSQEEEATILKNFPDSSIKTEKEILNKYDNHPIQKLVINFHYFKRAYVYSLLIFLIMFVLFYLLLHKDNSYLVYIIVSFFTYPFAKLFFDRLGIYTLREKIDKQTGVTYYLYQAIFFFDSLLYHSSIYLAPLGLLVLIIHLIIKKVRSQKNNDVQP